MWKIVGEYQDLRRSEFYLGLTSGQRRQKVHLAFGANPGSQPRGDDFAVDGDCDLCADAVVFDDPVLKTGVEAFECLYNLAHGRAFYWDLLMPLS